MSSSVLVPLDGSELSARTFPLAIGMAKATGSNVVLLHVIELPLGEVPAGAIEALERNANEILEEAARIVRQSSNLHPTQVVKVGYAPRVILEEIASSNVSAVVMGTHGRSGVLRVLLGSVAEKVLRQAPVAVLLMPPRAGHLTADGIRRILLPLDGSELSAAVIDPVTDLAAKLNAEITLCQVCSPPQLGPDEGFTGATGDIEAVVGQARNFLSAFLPRLEAKGVRGHARVELAGNVAQGIQQAAEEADAGCIALATHGRSGLNRLRYGSVAEAVLRGSRVAVMTFGPAALESLTAGKWTSVEGQPPVAG